MKSTAHIDALNKKITEQNKQAYKSVEQEGKVECPSCGDYYIDPTKYDVCWQCHMKGGE
jgi:hypothetical protein